MTDHFTDWLMAPLHLPVAQMTISPVSRLVLDMERFADDKQEVMSKVGMGVIYTGVCQTSCRDHITLHLQL